MIKNLIRSAFNTIGYRLVRNDSAPHTIAPSSAQGLEPFLSLIKRFGFDPKHIVDVGANKGFWTRRAIEFFPNAQYTLVEPQDHLKVYIQDLLDRGCKINWINAGAADQSGTLPFTISDRDDSSTFVPTPVDAEASRIFIPVKTLNEIVSASVAPPDMVKIDAEGFDLRALAGATDLLGKTDVFFVEAAICCPTYENTIARVIQRMDAAGYRVVDLTDINRSTKHGVLWLCELAFLRNGSPLFSGASTYE